MIKHKGSGISCVLTKTNEEAVITMALLQKNGINCKLIQSMSGFRFWNMAETRYFIKFIEKRIKTPLIDDELWNKAKQQTYSTYEGSQSLTYVKNCIGKFEQTNLKKYFNDLKEFVFESSLEDFCDASDSDVIVSTIHKSKGREFDNVHMLVSNSRKDDQNMMRRYYVGITRAKNQLFIHTDSNCFDGLEADKCVTDKRQYDMPEEIILQLSHKDVHLGFFKDRRQDILSLRGGDELTYNDLFLYNSSGKPVAKLSLIMQEELSERTKRGYKVKSASVKFIVAWRPKEAPSDEPETAVILADLTLTP